MPTTYLPKVIFIISLKNKKKQKTRELKRNLIKFCMTSNILKSKEEKLLLWWHVSKCSNKATSGK
jgi:hypothetical protein